MGVEARAISQEQLKWEVREQLPLHLDRKYALMYLLTALEVYAKKRLTSNDVSSLAQVIYNDTKEGKTRSLKEVSEEAGLLPVKDQKPHSFGNAIGQLIFGRGDFFSEDIFLNHVALNYSQKEMEVKPEDLTRPVQPGEVSSSYPGFRAGSGPARPLLIDLYRLDSLGQINIFEDNVEGQHQEIFVPTISGRAFSEAIDINFQGDEKVLRGFLLLMDEHNNSWKLIPKPQPEKVATS